MIKYLLPMGAQTLILATEQSGGNLLSKLTFVLCKGASDINTGYRVTLGCSLWSGCIHKIPYVALYTRYLKDTFVCGY